MDMDNVIYDIINKKELSIEDIKLNNNNINKQESKRTIRKFLRLMYEESFCVAAQYILVKNKNHLFTLVDIDTKQEFECATNKTLLLYLKLPTTAQNLKIVKKISFLRLKNHQKVYGCAIFNRIFALKGVNKLPKLHKNIKKILSPTILRFRKNSQFIKKIKNNLRSRLSIAIRHTDAIKSDNTFNLVGCSIDFLVQYLETKFQHGMTWDNYGKGCDDKREWNIDHIKPCVSFNLLDPNEQKLCFHYTNLQPLWAIDNRSKYNKLDWIKPI
jgi:hypothetical protein